MAKNDAQNSKNNYFSAFFNSYEKGLLSPKKETHMSWSISGMTSYDTGAYFAWFVLAVH